MTIIIIIIIKLMFISCSSHVFSFHILTSISRTVFEIEGGSFNFIYVIQRSTEQS